MIKTLITILFVTCATFGQLTVTAPTITADVNSKVTVPISVTNAVGIISFQYNVNFDSSVITFRSCEVGDLAAPMNVLCNVTPDGVLHTVAWGSSNFSGDGEVMLLNFYTHSGATPLKLRQVYFFDQFGSVALTATNGSITLQ